MRLRIISQISGLVLTTTTLFLLLVQYRTQGYCVGSSSCYGRYRFGLILSRNICQKSDSTKLLLSAYQGNSRNGDSSGDDDFDDDITSRIGDNKDEDEEEEDDDDDYYTYIPTKIPTAIIEQKGGVYATSASSSLWELGNDFHQFLNQCTIQSFLFLLRTCRDPQTVLWIEKFTKPNIETYKQPVQQDQEFPTGASENAKLLTYHGLAAMNVTKFPTWDSYYYELMSKPKVVCIIESNQAHIPEYELEINPPSLCTRLLSVREQIAKEFKKDLLVIATKMGPESLLPSFTSSSNNNNNNNDPLRTPSTATSTRLFLEFDPFMDIGDVPSPLRKGNFDLLLLLITQESIHRILNNNDQEDSDSDNNLTKSDEQYLSNFYLNRLITHFTGRVGYNKADEFIYELIDNGQQDIAEHILRIRQNVAKEWSKLAATIPELHTNIRREQLKYLMQSYQNNNEDTAFQ